jgi:UDP-N-acetylglucosamine--N-acetylmuramyl-(pentapeptide) pyrophosphoryl-undecaprenol N-acetylglucosamine transferase
MALSFVIAGGGTGGHVTPALALGEVIRQRGDRVLFVGSQQGLEAKLVPDAGFELVALPSQQVMGRSLLGRLRGVLGILGQVSRARTALAECNADVVISVGGFAAMPAALAAVLGRRPLVLVEPNAIPGRVNRLTARFAKLVFVGFDAATAQLGGASRRVQHVGIPLRQALLDAFDEQPEREPVGERLHLLVFGGSQGAQQLNEAMIEIAPGLAGLPVEIFHQTGEADRERVESAYRAAGLDARVTAFEPDMPARYRWADLALCRAGALTVAELAMAGLPAILVPYPYAADDHQTANAEALTAAGAGRRLDSRPLDNDALGAALRQLIDDPTELVAMGRAASSLARPEASRHIIDACARLAAGDMR